MIIIFTDLDGTLIDEKYSFEDAIDAINLIKSKGIPLILTSSKTRAEIELYIEKLDIKQPFISENGGGIFIPENYFNFEFKFDKKINSYKVIELGTEYKKLRKILAILKKNFEIVGFGDMDVYEIAEKSNLSLEQAKLAKKREYDEPVLMKREIEDKIREILKEYDCHLVRGGKFYHILGQNDKGKSVYLLTKLFKQKYGNIKTIGLGDSENDIGMLKNVDVPVLVKKTDGSYDEKVILEIPEIIKTKFPGPKGWGLIIKELITKY